MILTDLPHYPAAFYWGHHAGHAWHNGIACHEEVQKGWLSLGIHSVWPLWTVVKEGIEVMSSSYNCTRPNGVVHIAGNRVQILCHQCAPCFESSHRWMSLTTSTTLHVSSFCPSQLRIVQIELMLLVLSLRPRRRLSGPDPSRVDVGKFLLDYLMLPSIFCLFDASGWCLLFSHCPVLPWNRMLFCHLCSRLIVSGSTVMRCMYVIPVNTLSAPVLLPFPWVYYCSLPK